MRVLMELHAQGLPALVFDFHGQFSDSTGPYLRTAQPVVLDASVGLPFSPFEADIDQSTGARYWKTNAFAMAGIFQYVCGLGIIQQDLVFQAIRGAYEDAGFATRDDARLPTVNELADRLAELSQRWACVNVLPRCRPFLEFNLFPSRPRPICFAELFHRAQSSTFRGWVWRPCNLALPRSSFGRCTRICSPGERPTRCDWS